jgi:YtkA-like protein
VYFPGLERAGAAGHFHFTLVSSTPAPPALDDNRFVVQVSDADGNPVEGELTVALDMPEHGHASPKQPDIRFDAESQAFSLEPIDLFMVGLWRIRFDFEARIDGAPPTDSAVFEFCID